MVTNKENASIMQQEFMMWLTVDKGYTPAQYKKLTKSKLTELAKEFRQFMGKTATINIT